MPEKMCKALGVNIALDLCAREMRPLGRRPSASPVAVTDISARVSLFSWVKSRSKHSPGDLTDGELGNRRERKSVTGHILIATIAY